MQCYSTQTIYLVTLTFHQMIRSYRKLREPKLRFKVQFSNKTKLLVEKRKLRAFN